jgi:hypothetical protein
MEKYKLKELRPVNREESMKDKIHNILFPIFLIFMLIGSALLVFGNMDLV